MNATRERGFALIAVLVALAILLTLAVPFLLGSTLAETSSQERVDRLQTEWAAASVRDLLLARAARGAPGVDLTPLADAVDEFPAQVDLQKPFDALLAEGRHLLGGEVYDLERRLDLNTVGPLALANLLGTTTRLSGLHAADADRLTVERADRLPPQGFVLVDRELIGYGRVEGNVLRDLRRGLLAEAGLELAHELHDGSLVLDYRVLLAVQWTFDRPGLERRRRVPYSSVRELARLAELGFGAFTAEELDRLELHCATGAIPENGTLFGKAERVFNAEIPAGTRVLQVRSARFLGGGSVVRVRSLDGRTQEYALVWSTEQPDAPLGDVALPNRWHVNLLFPLAQEFRADETVVEPLVPVPVNANTASPEVLTALLANLRPARQVRFQRDGDTVKPTAFQPPLSDAEVRTFTDQIVALRGDRAFTLDEQRAGGEGAPRAFDGWEDLVKRVFRPRFAEAADDQAKRRLLLLYSALLNGKDGSIEMGTAPLTFASGNAVAYRAAAARRRIAGQEVGRLELSGVAAVMPGAALQRLFHTQEGLEEAFRLDRRAPYFQTFPINVAALLPNDLGTDPASRHFAHLVPEAFPQMGMGAARFPARDPLGAALRPAPSSTPYGGQLRTHQAMTVALDPEGRDVVQEGPYEMENSGPAPGAGPAGPQGPQAGGAARNRFPFSGRGGYVARHAVSFWFKLKDLGDQALYDLSATEPDRNRIRLLVQNREVVFEVLDEAGVDPDPSRSKTQVERSAARWRVPVDQARLQPDVWYHVSLSAEGTRPGQITLLLDGVPRSQPDLRTFLTAPIPAYKEQNSGRPFYDEPLLHPKIQVESTEGFPEQGVLRVGLELFEYTSKTPSTFECKYVDSFGGRVARMGLFEYRPDLPVDSSGRPTRNAEDLVRGQNLDVTPEHPSGAAVELYGYSLPIYRDTILNPGSARLTGEIQAFAIARAYVSNAKTITVAGQRSSITLGRGLPASASENPDIELGDPVVPVANASYPPAQAPDRIAGAFPTTGGYALLVQYADERNYQPDPTTTAAFAFGGIEVIRYTSRQGNKLSGITRAAQLPGQQVTVRGLYDGQPRTFIFDYDKSITVGRTPARDLIQYQCYAVPISLSVQGQVTDPTTLGYVEWLQIYPGAGDAENDTEWVRYDLLVDRQHVVRTQPSAWFSVFRAITSRGAANSGQPIGPGGGSLTPGDEGQLDYGQPRGDGVRRIGYLDPIEDVGKNGYPIVHVTRQALGFRGDPFTGTTSHTQRANAMVLPVHRMELDWGNYGALTGRAGRHDRIGLVGGLATASGSRAALEWHTANWTARRYGSDNPQQGQQRGAVQRLGRYPFQLVGFKDPLRTLYTGPTDRNDLADVRAVDRIVKFPSGELPAAYVDLATFGATRQQDVNPSRAVIDEIDLVRHRHPPSDAPLAAILDQNLSDTGAEILVRADLGVSPVGPVAAGNVLATIPPTGGLLRIDDEILAYSEYQSGRFTVARSGRGLLGTQPRAHAEGAMVFFLDQVPAAILAEGVSETGATLQLQGLGELSPFSGTVLLKTELLHYTWTRAGRTLEMPRWSDPERPDTQGRGLFRGRYGTLPVSALGGEPVIAFPFRYWDRHHERADDPEQAYLQLSPRSSPVYYTGITWEEELPDPLVDLHCYVRVDERSRFDQEPGVAPGLYLFRDPLANGRPNPIGWQGSRLEARFVHVYRPGAFDPITFQGQAWKRAPTVKSVRIGYEGGSRILEERVTAR